MHIYCIYLRNIRIGKKKPNKQTKQKTINQTAMDRYDLKEKFFI